MNLVSIQLSIFFSGCGKPRITGCADNESVEMEARLYFKPQTLKLGILHLWIGPLSFVFRDNVYPLYSMTPP
jgi:hypothetical protein